MVINKKCRTINKTFKYLFPALKLYGDGVKNILNYFDILGVGLGDTMLTNTGLKSLPTNVIYILLDNTVEEKRYNNFKYIDHLKNCNVLMADYTYNFKGENFTMLILKLPEELGNIINKFLTGKYSEMYTKKQIDFIFPEGMYDEVRNVLLRGDTMIPKFLKTLEEEFSVAMTLQDFYDDVVELELPPKTAEEYFS